MNDDNDSLLSKKKVAQKLGRTSKGLDTYRKKHPDFPAGIKEGETRQARVFFSSVAVDDWIRKVIRQQGEKA